MKRTAFLVSAAVFLIAFTESDQPVPLRATSQEYVATLSGGTTTCDRCVYDGARQDECFHAGQVDECSTTACIANFLVEDTCFLSDIGSCYAIRDASADDVIHYKRADSACQTNNPNTWQLWKIHYYGGDCSMNYHWVRCQKPTNNCNGTLISTATTKNGIVCQ